MSASSTRPLSAPPNTFSMSDGVTLNRSEKKRSGRARTGSVMSWSGSCGTGFDTSAHLYTTQAFRERTTTSILSPTGRGAREASATTRDAKWHWRSACRLEILHDFVDETQAVHERRAGRQNVRAIDLVDRSASDRRHVRPARASGARRGIHGVPAHEARMISGSRRAPAFSS